MNQFFNFLPGILLLGLTGCFGGSEGSPALKIFSALGICLATIFIVFYIVIKGGEKE